MARNGRSDWQSVVERFRGSGLSQKQFCEREGVSLSTFCYWLKKASASVQTSAGSAAFVELDFLAPVPRREETSELVVELPMGVVLKFRGVAR